MKKWLDNIKNNIPSIMGILNVTPDSFFDGGHYLSEEKIKQRIENFIENNVEIIDIGGESSRPGASKISIDEEIKRVIPAIKIAKKLCNIPLSIDTYKPEVAKISIEEGVEIVNDINGLSDEKMIEIVSKNKSYVIIMHKHGEPATMQDNPLHEKDEDIVIDFLKHQIEKAIKANIKKDRILIDPGIGFGKSFELNVKLIKNIKKILALGIPVVIGVSRKSFIGKILNLEPQDRLIGSISVQLISILNGVNIIRTHDIKETREMIEIYKTFYK